MSDLATLIAKDAIRDLVLAYSRAVDRKDVALLRDLYTADATDTHGDSFDGPASAYCDFIERALPHMAYSGHHVCNHQIAVNGDEAEGEVYALAFHIIPDGASGWQEDMMAVRYVDRYRKEADGLWRFARRIVTYDMRVRRPYAHPVAPIGNPADDPSFTELMSRAFNRGVRG